MSERTHARLTVFISGNGNVGNYFFFWSLHCYFVLWISPQWTSIICIIRSKKSYLKSYMHTSEWGLQEKEVVETDCGWFILILRFLIVALSQKQTKTVLVLHVFILRFKYFLWIHTFWLISTFPLSFFHVLVKQL